MDFREYDYIRQRPDTLSKGTLDSIKNALLNHGSSNAPLIDKILATGYLEPPTGYKWGACYKVDLSRAEIQAVIDDLVKVRAARVTRPVDEKPTQRALGQYIECFYGILSEVPETYEAYKAKQVYYDLRNISFDAFLDVIFEHPVVDRDKKGKEWYWQGSSDAWIDWDRSHVVDLYIELFSRSDGLPARYSNEKLEQGFWFLMGGSLEFTIYELLHDEELDIGLKERLIGSMYHLYEKLYFDEPLETSSYMWWDALCHEYGVPGATGPASYEEDKRIQDAMFSTLVKILDLDSDICHVAALHGLGHLQHPETERVIKDFMKKHPKLTEDQIDYCNNCITGDIL